MERVAGLFSMGIVKFRGMPLARRLRRMAVIIVRARAVAMRIQICLGSSFSNSSLLWLVGVIFGLPLGYFGLG